VRELLGDLSEVRNARCLSSATASVSPGRVLRSATTAFASDADVATLVSGLSVTHIMDLRSNEEIDKDPPAGSGQGLARAVTRDLQYERASSSSAPAQALAVRELVAPAGGGDAPGGPGLTRHRVAIMDRERFYKALLARMAGSDPLTLVASLVTRVFDGQRAQDMLLAKVNAGGLPLLYEVLLDTSGPELCAALRTVTECAERREPLLFYCKAGKDRTGLVAMLLLSVMGATDEQIVEDYYLSDLNRKMALGDIAKDDELRKLDKSIFNGAPREAMEHVLSYIRGRYGDRDGYLDRIGFGAAWRDRLRAALEADGESLPSARSSEGGPGGPA